MALHCCKAHAKFNRKMGNSTPCKIVTPKNLNLKLCIRDYVGESTNHANFGTNRYSGASPHIGEILPLCDFVMFCPVLFFLGNAPRLNRAFSVLKRWVTSFGEICPQTSPQKMGVNRQFQVKTAKYKNRNTSETINSIKTKFEDQPQTNNCTSWMV